MTELFFSTDVESDGPLPGPNSMLSFGTAVFSRSGYTGHSFEANLELLPGAAPDPATAEFWDRNPEAYAATRVDPRSPVEVMTEYVEWVDGVCKRLGGQAVFSAYPAGYDFLFMYWYMVHFAKRSPFSFSALDVKSVAMVKFGLPYRKSVKRNFPKSVLSKRKHTHIGIDDAMEQGELLVNILNYRE